MVNAKRNNVGGWEFQGKHSEEHVQFYFRQHWIRLVWPLAKVTFVSLLLIAVGYYLLIELTPEDDAMRKTLLITLVVLFLIAQFEFLHKFYRYFLYVIVVTDKKIHRIKKTLLVFDDHQSVDLWMLQDIHRSQHGPIQNLFGFGTLTMEAQDSVLRVHFVPRIGRKYERMMHLREHARAQMAYGRIVTAGQSS